MKIQILKKIYMVSILINNNYIIGGEKSFPEVYAQIPGGIRRKLLEVFEEGKINNKYIYNQIVDDYIQSISPEIPYTKFIFCIYLLISFLFQHKKNSITEYKNFFTTSVPKFFTDMKTPTDFVQYINQDTLDPSKEIIVCLIQLVIMSILNHFLYDIFEIINNFSGILFIISFIIITLVINYLIYILSTLILYGAYAFLRYHLTTSTSKTYFQENGFKFKDDFCDASRKTYTDLIFNIPHEGIFLILMYIQYINKKNKEINYNNYCGKFHLMKKVYDNQNLARKKNPQITQNLV